MRRIYVLTISKTRLLSLLAALLAAFALLAVSVNHDVFIRMASFIVDIPESSTRTGKLAIIIDDFGSDRDGVKEMMSIDRHMTFAVMPFSPFTKEVAEYAHLEGYEIIAHLPMESNYGKKSWLGKLPILAGMDADIVREIVRESIDDVPYAVGANIHMGSKASGKEIVISAVLDVIKEKGLYFVDSRTAVHPIASELAKSRGVVCYDRDVFLDGQQPKSFVKRRLREAAKLAVERGYAVAIGHVGIEGGKVTAEAIAEMLKEFDSMGVELVFVSELKL